MSSSPHSTSRRHLLALGGSAALSPLLGTRSAWADTPKVPRRTLGKTGQKIPILLLGGAMGFDKKFDPKIAEALRYGVDYIDGARVYAGGKCDIHARATLKQLGALDKVWLTSKSPEHSADGFERQLDKSLKDFGRKHVDMFYLHGLKSLWTLDDKKLFKRVELLKKQGKLRHFGFSCHDGNVAELLQKAATIPLIDSVMFRYNFRQYGDKKLNAAMDAAHKAGIGLIAMKTQGAEASFRDAWKKFEQSGKWTKHQAVLKAVWADPRITAAVSHMDNMTKLRQNIAAALDKQKLGALDQKAIQRYAAATRCYACDGCDHLCGGAVDADVNVNTSMRAVMYHDVYEDPDKARRVFSGLPRAQQQLAGVDFSKANEACPHGVDVAAHMGRATELFG